MVVYFDIVMVTVAVLRKHKPIFMLKLAYQFQKYEDDGKYKLMKCICKKKVFLYLGSEKRKIIV
jgi:hypothetical protein